MAGIGYWLARDLRRRWRTLAFLALLVALGAGTTLAALAGARRNETAVDRLVEGNRPADVMALTNEPGFDWDAVREYPEVAGVAEFAVSGFAVDEIPENEFFPLASDGWLREVERAIVYDGRVFDQSRVDEVVVSKDARDELGIEVGDTVTIRMATPEALAADDFANLDGPVVEATVVGVVRTPYGYGGAWVLNTVAFWDRYQENILPEVGYVNALVRLRGGEADIPAFQARLDEQLGRPAELASLVDDRRKLRDTTDFEADALRVFALVALLATVVLVGQALSRLVSVTAGDLAALGTFGVPRGPRALAAVVGPALAGLAGAVLATLGAWAVSDRFPIGRGRDVDPFGGRELNVAVVIGGAFVTVVVVAGGALAFALLQHGPRVAPRTRASRIARVAAGAGAPLPVTMGTRLALERGAGNAAVPVRPALVGAIVGVLGVVAVVTFQHGLNDAASDPEAFGQRHELLTGTFRGGPPFPADELDVAAGLRDVDFVTEAPISVIETQERAVTVMGLSDVKGHYGLARLQGREPSGPDEIFLGPKESDALGVDVGDEIVLEGGTALHVVGVGFVPVAIHNSYDESAVMTREGFDRIAPDSAQWKFHLAFIGLDDGGDVEAAIGSILERSGLQTEPAFEVSERDNLRTVKTVPVVLSVFLAALAMAAVGHALASAVRRRRGEVAVVRALGMTRAQARWSVVTQASTLALVGIVVGLPLGIVLGRTVWRSVAESTPLLYRAPLAAVALVVVPLAALALSNVLAAVPARRAARLRTAEVLRSE